MSHRVGTSVRRGLPALLVLGLWLTGCGADPEPVAGEERARVTASTGQEQVVRCAGKGPAVVLVNGIGDSATSAQWVEVVRLLSPRARVCRYDRPGTGESGDPDRAGRGADELDAELDAVVAHAAGDDRVVLVAHSFGAHLARVYADRHADRLRGLVLVDGLDPSVGVVAGTGADSFGDVPMAAEALDLADVEATAASVQRLDAGLHVTVLTRGVGASAPWLHGQRRLTALTADAQSVAVPDAGHQIPSEDPQAVVDAVEDMLATAG